MSYKGLQPLFPRPARRVGVPAVLAAVLATGSAGCDRPAPETPAAPPPPAAVTPPPDAAAPTEALTAPLSDHFRLIEQQRTGAARVRLRKHLNRNPDDGRAAFLFGLSYHREKRYALARPWFEQAIEHAPEYDPAWYFFGWALYYLGEV